MMLHGWCLECHKFRRIRLNGPAMARLAGKSVPTGTCDECSDKIDSRTSWKRR